MFAPVRERAVRAQSTMKGRSRWSVGGPSFGRSLHPDPFSNHGERARCCAALLSKQILRSSQARRARSKWEAGRGRGRMHHSLCLNTCWRTSLKVPLSSFSYHTATQRALSNECNIHEGSLGCQIATSDTFISSLQFFVIMQCITIQVSLA